MYSIPKSDKVIVAIRDVLARYKVINSQKKLKALVERQLNQGGGNFRVGGTRLRMLAIHSGVAHVEVHGREMGSKEPITNCPVCGDKLKYSKNKTVFGGTVTLGYTCPTCTYWTGVKRRVPMRYVFNIRRR